MKQKLLYKNSEIAADVIKNTVTVQLDELSYQFSNSAEVSLLASSALIVQQNEDKPVVCKGQFLTYHIVVSNNGPSNASGILLKDTLPEESIVSSVHVDKGSYTLNENVITWNIDKLNKNDYTYAHITIIPQKQGIISNYIVASENEFNPDPRYFSSINTIVKYPPSRGIEFFQDVSV